MKKRMQYHLKEGGNMGFYEEMNSKEERANYEEMLQLVGSLSKLFSANDVPYLASRTVENAFCEFLHAENLARQDVTADAKKSRIGIGIKTWMSPNGKLFGNPWQKIAEFDKNRPYYENDEIKDLVFKIAGYRNDRIFQTKKQCGLDGMVYHCIVRIRGEIAIQECPLVPIDVEHIQNISKNRNTVFFDDGINRYKFTIPKSTLLKCFDDLRTIKRLSVDILDDPWIPLKRAVEKYVG